MKRAALILIAAVAIVGNGCDKSSVASNPKDAPQSPSNTAPSQPAAPSTSARGAEAGDILSVLTVEHQVDLSSQRDGTVTSLAKDEGNVVKSGEILGRLDDRMLHPTARRAGVRYRGQLHQVVGRPVRH